MRININSKKLVLLFFGWLIIFPTLGVAQSNESSSNFEKQRSDRINLDATAALSTAAGALHERLSQPLSSRERIQILQDAVLIGDRSIVPYLKARKEGGYGPAQYIEIALVALGENQYVSQTIEELNSDDPAVQYWAIWKLARFKTKESYQKLYELLDDETNRDNDLGDDYIIQTLSFKTKEILFSVVEDPPKERRDTAAWKEWFRKNNLID